MIDYGYFDQSELEPPLFYPHDDPSPPPPGAKDYLIEVSPGIYVGGRYYLAEKGFPTILYFHGNGEVAGDHDDIAQIYHGIGLNLFVAEFRGYGRSNGEPSCAALVGDAHPIATRFCEILAEEKVSGVRFLMGRSLGAQPALELAAHRSELFRGLILESAAGRLTRLFGRLPRPAPENIRREMTAAHEEKIAKITLPALMIHGEGDELIPLADAKHIHSLLRSSELIVIPGAGHNDIISRGTREYFDAIQAFVDRLTAP